MTLHFVQDSQELALHDRTHLKMAALEAVPFKLAAAWSVSLVHTLGPA